MKKHVFFSTSTFFTKNLFLTKNSVENDRIHGKVSETPPYSLQKRFSWRDLVLVKDVISKPFYYDAKSSNASLTPKYLYHYANQCVCALPNTHSLSSIGSLYLYLNKDICLLEASQNSCGAKSLHLNPNTNHMITIDKRSYLLQHSCTDNSFRINVRYIKLSFLEVPLDSPFLQTRSLPPGDGYQFIS